MVVESLEVSDFRNYREAAVRFSPGTNLLYGDNAQGKTNLLEAIYLCGTTRSHRMAKDRDMVRFGAENAHLRALVRKDSGLYQVDLHLKQRGAKGVAVNKAPVRRAQDLFGVLHLVLFSPEDLQIVKGGPAERRRFVDMELSQIDPVYLSDLTDYNRALSQRNRLLKDLERDPGLSETLPLWDEQLVRFGSRVIRRRREFVEEICPTLERIHSDLTGGKERLTLSYEPDAAEKNFGEELALAEERDIRFGSTSRGPHRDDVSFISNNIDIRRFGSQGQQRTTALSLKLAELTFVEERIRETPVLLLDDVLSELDQDRRRFLLKRIGGIQTIVTGTGPEEFLREAVAVDKVFRVTEGQIEEMERHGGRAEL